MAGYSGTPLAKKLGIGPGTRLHLIAAPPEYRDWLAPLPDDVVFEPRHGKANCDVVHLFVESRAELRRALPKARQTISPAGAIWVSWHKKSSGIPSDVTEDIVRGLALDTDLVDVKVCAVTDIWSGLKLVIRKHLR
ncbi:MAG TPA: hypothetical protein VHY79_15110 [Rhizomicrobium sp.]|nr:hypothetical protein [Rhizomicrobium sp.]